MNRKKLLSLLFHRTVLVALLLLIQVGMLAAMVLRFSDYFAQFYLACVSVSLLAVLHIINKKGEIYTGQNSPVLIRSCRLGNNQQYLA